MFESREKEWDSEAGGQDLLSFISSNIYLWSTDYVRQGSTCCRDSIEQVRQNYLNLMLWGGKRIVSQWISLSTPALLTSGLSFIAVGTVLCTTECWAVYLASTTRCQQHTHPFPFVTTKNILNIAKCPYWVSMQWRNLFDLIWSFQSFSHSVSFYWVCAVNTVPFLALKMPRGNQRVKAPSSPSCPFNKEEVTLIELKYTWQSSATLNHFEKSFPLSQPWETLFPQHKERAAAPGKGAPYHILSFLTNEFNKSESSFTIPRPVSANCS